MTQLTREAVMQAVFALFAPALINNPQQIVAGSYAAGSAPTADKPFAMASRRIQMPSQVPSENKPCLFLTEHEEQTSQVDNSDPGKTTIQAAIWIFTDAGQAQDIMPITVLNNLLDTTMNALTPNPIFGTIQLGGKVSNVFVNGRVVKVDGALDGNGIAFFPLMILIPCF